MRLLQDTHATRARGEERTSSRSRSVCRPNEQIGLPQLRHREIWISATERGRGLSIIVDWTGLGWARSSGGWD